MSNNELFIYKSIVSDMAEGVITIGMDGEITSINVACEKILNVSDMIVGIPFAVKFFEFTENDGFNQSILDAIYENKASHNNIVDFFTGNETKKLMLTTSYLKNGNEKIGVIAVINDLTELLELRDAVVAMEKIKALNEQLEVRNKFIYKTFGRYLSDDIVKNILDTEEGLEIGGKKQEVTIMFSDLRGFTAISEMMQPTDLIAMLNHYLAEMIEIINKYKGTILEFIGDAIVVVFSAPIFDLEAGEHAVKCAIAMQNQMEKVNEYNILNNYPKIEMGIGIHTGEVILGNIGSEKKTKYDIIGKNVNLASRIETFTVGGQVLISEQTKSCAENVKIKGTKEIFPKGVSTPITIYDVESIGNLLLHTDEQIFTKLDKVIPIEISIIDGKSASRDTVPAHILELSARQAILDINLDKNTNIKFVHDGQEIFAKFVDENKIHITMGEIR